MDCVHSSLVGGRTWKTTVSNSVMICMCWQHFTSCKWHTPQGICIPPPYPSASAGKQIQALLNLQGDSICWLGVDLWEDTQGSVVTLSDVLTWCRSKKVTAQDSVQESERVKQGLLCPNRKGNPKVVKVLAWSYPWLLGCPEFIRCSQTAAVSHIHRMKLLKQSEWFLVQPEKGKWSYGCHCAITASRAQIVTKK